MKYFLLVLFVAILSLIAAWFFINEKENGSNFSMPEYLSLAPGLSLSEEQERMISVYHDARSQMLKASTSAAVFEEHIYFETPEQRALYNELDKTLGLTISSGDTTITTRSNYIALFPPHVAYDNKAIVIAFNDTEMWLLENIQGSLGEPTSDDRRITYGHKMSNVNFVLDDNDEYKIEPVSFGQLMTFDGSEVIVDSTGIQIEPNNSWPRPIIFSSKTYVYGNGYGDTEPLPLSEALKRIDDYYSSE